MGVFQDLEDRVALFVARELFFQLFINMLFGKRRHVQECFAVDQRATGILQDSLLQIKVSERAALAVTGSGGLGVLFSETGDAFNRARQRELIFEQKVL